MSTKTCLNIVIADKNSLMVKGLAEMFKQDDRFDVRATATDGELFLKLVERISFDVGIIGWKMPYSDGHRVLTNLRERGSSIRVVVTVVQMYPDRFVFWVEQAFIQKQNRRKG